MMRHRPSPIPRRWKRRIYISRGVLGRQADYFAEESTLTTMKITVRTKIQTGTMKMKSWKKSKTYLLLELSCPGRRLTTFMLGIR